MTQEIMSIIVKFHNTLEYSVSAILSMVYHVTSINNSSNTGSLHITATSSDKHNSMYIRYIIESETSTQVHLKFLMYI